ncbi:MAG: peptide deformylase [Pseudomonadota bacterium]
MIRPLVLHPGPRLSEVSATVDAFDEDLAALVRDLFDTMYDAPGRGLAAIQIGVAARVFVMDAGWKDGAPSPITFVNPVITDHGTELAVQEEGCLSIPNTPRRVARPAQVTLRWQDIHGAPQERTFTGFEAACVQHEFDHLEGVTILDHPEPLEAGA